MKVKSFVGFVSCIIVCMFMVSCGIDTNPPDSERWSDEDSVIAVLNDSCIAVDYEPRLRSKYFIYRYYFEDDRSEDIGSVDNFIMTYGCPVKIDNSLYMFITSGNGTSTEERLYKIDLETNTLQSLYIHPDNYPLSPVATTSNNLYFLGVNQNADASITSRLYYHDFSDSSNHFVCEKNYGSDGIGETMVHLSATHGKVYTLTRVFGVDLDTYVIDEYDESLSHIRRINIGDSFGDISSEQKLTKFVVIDDYVFLRTTSKGVIGKMKDNSVELVFEDPLLRIAYNPSGQYNGYCWFYLMRSNNIYSLNLVDGSFDELIWSYGDDHIIKSVSASDAGYLVRYYADGTSGSVDLKTIFIPVK